jgi:hypothetical protein
MDLFSADDVGGGGGGGSSGRAETRMMSVPRAKSWTGTAPKPLSLELALKRQGESAVCPVSLVEQKFMMDAAWGSPGTTSPNLPT